MRLLKSKYSLGAIAILAIVVGFNFFQILTQLIVSTSGVPSLSIDDFRELPKGSFVLLDAREPKEFEVSHIQGAVLGGFEDFNIESLPLAKAEARKVVVYCSVGYRSGRIASMLRDENFDVVNLRGGIFEWSRRGLPLVDPRGQATELVHGYQRPWSYFLHSDIVILN